MLTNSRNRPNRRRAVIAIMLAAFALLAALPVLGANADRRPSPLTFTDCIANRGAWGCEDSVHDSLAAASALAVSPDGANVYVASSFNFEAPHIGANSITTFSRAPNGGLSEQGCLLDAAPPPGAKTSRGCAVDPTASLHGADQILASPDGRNVYVVSRGGPPGQPSAITELGRGPGGELVPLGCISADTSTGCSPFPHHGVEETTTIDKIAISPDGTDVYVRASESSQATGSGPSSISQFSRSTDGSLTEASCIATSGAGGCALAPESWGFGAIAISPDGADLYSLSSDSVQQLSIQPDGSLLPRGCIGYLKTSGCGTLGGQSLSGALQITVAPDGRSLYVAGGDSVTELARAADGSLAQTECLSSGRKGEVIVRGCQPTKHDRVGVNLLGAVGVAAGPDGRLYITHLSGVTVYGHEADGRLVERGCIANNGPGGRVLTPGCARTAHPSLRGADGLALSPDARNVYVASLTGLSVTWFTRHGR